MIHHFKAKIYKVGINAVVDVPARITKSMKPDKGYMKVKGIINGFDFKTTLVPVKDAPHRLFVNMIMLKGGNTAVDKTASFSIEQYFATVKKEYPMLPAVKKQLKENNLLKKFEQLTGSRKKDILRYLANIKTEETLQKNIDKLIRQLQEQVKVVRVP